jgi:uncharacterized protein with HEPN domain
MKRDSLHRLDDILDSIGKIQSYIHGKTEADFLNDYSLQDAVTRRLEIIGEAAKHVDDSIREQSDEIPWKSIAGLRDIAIHDYAELLVGRIWKTVFRELPTLKRQIEQLKQNLTPVPESS